MKKLPILLTSILLVVLFLSPSKVSANSGPVGQNEIRTESGPGVGEITLMWRRVDLNITNYTLVYGTTSKQYTYGAHKIGNIVTFTVKALTPGQTYCFQLYPHLNDQISTPLSPEICDVAATQTTTIVGTTGPFGRNLLKATSGPGSGNITLNWKRFFPDTQSYTLIYGIQPGKYIYGVVDARDASNPNDNDFVFIVGALNPGTRYYFALIPKVGGQALYITAEVSAIAP